MLTTTPKVGDRVVIDYTKDSSSRTSRQKELLPVEKVGNKYLWVNGDRYV